MKHLRKKDYLQRIIDELFAKMQEALNGANLSDEERMDQLRKCFDFFGSNFDTKMSDSVSEIISKIDTADLLEQYAKLLYMKSDLLDLKDKDELMKALHLIKYLDANDRTFSWNRSVLKQDILRLLSM